MGGPVTPKPEFDFTNGFILDPQHDAETFRGPQVSMPAGLVEPELELGFPQRGTKVRTRTLPKEEKIMSYIDRLAVSITAQPAPEIPEEEKPISPLFFNQVLNSVKNTFPGIVQKFNEPPTYVWLPKDAEAPLNMQLMKDSLKVRFPKLMWTPGADGIPRAFIDFPDGKTAEFALGIRPDQHFTLTYRKK